MHGLRRLHRLITLRFLQSESTFCLSPQCGYSQWALGTRKPKPISSLRLPGYITNIYKSENMEITSKVLDPPTHEILEPKIIYTGL
jgi:hypothetical protein